MKDPPQGTEIYSANRSSHHYSNNIQLFFTPKKSSKTNPHVLLLLLANFKMNDSPLFKHIDAGGTFANTQQRIDRLNVPSIVAVATAIATTGFNGTLS